MRTKKQSTVVGVFHDRARAQEAVNALKKAGFADDQMGVVTKGHDAEPSIDHATNSKVAEGAATGAAAGAGIGALWALGIAANLVPGIGWVAGGTLMAVLASAGLGATVATVVGALVGLGIPEKEAEFYVGEVDAGRTIVTVQAGPRRDDAWALLERYGAYNHATRDMSAEDTSFDEPTDEGRTIQVHEEQLHADKHTVNAGEVRVRKNVVTENKTINVPVTREEVIVERRPVGGRASTDSIRDGEEIRIPVSEERVEVTKDTVLKEEVKVGKRKVTGNQTVTGAVRKENVSVDPTGDVKVRGKGQPRAK